MTSAYFVNKKFFLLASQTSFVFSFKSRSFLWSVFVVLTRTKLNFLHTIAIPSKTLKNPDQQILKRGKIPMYNECGYCSFLKRFNVFNGISFALQTFCFFLSSSFSFRTLVSHDLEFLLSFFLCPPTSTTSVIIVDEKLKWGLAV